MNTEEAIQKIAAILDENRELKETIRELNTDIHIKDRGISQRISMIDEIKQDRDWWRTSALGTEKARAHLDIKLVECRNMVDEQRAVIHVMSGGHGEKIIADNEMLKAKLVDANRRFNHVVRFNEKLVHDTNKLFAERDATIDAQNARIKELQKERDDLKTEFENAPHGKRFLINELFAELNTIIEELKSKLINKEQQLNEAHKLLQDMTSHDWEQSNEITSMKISHGKERKTNRQMIKELESKLADRERQFDTLDGVLDRTRELLHTAMDRIQTQNDEITKKDDWISSYSKNDKRLNRLLDELLADVRKRDKIIDKMMGERAQ